MQIYIVLSSTAAIPGLLKAIMIILAVVAPLALIPLTFRWAGGALGAISGRLDSWRGGALQNMRKRSGDKKAQRRSELAHKARNEDFLRGGTKRTEFANRMIRRISNPASMIPGGIPLLGGVGRRARASIADFRGMKAREEYERISKSGQNQEIVLMRAVHQGRNPRDSLRWADNEVAHGRMSPQQRQYIADNIDRVQLLQATDSGREGAAIASVADGYMMPADYNAIPSYAGGAHGVSRVTNFFSRQKRLRLTQAGFYADGEEVHYSNKNGRTTVRETHLGDLFGQKTLEARNDVLRDANGQERYYGAGEVMIEEAQRDADGKMRTVLRPAKEKEVKMQVNDHVDEHNKLLSRVNLADKFVEGVNSDFLEADGVENPQWVRTQTLRSLAALAATTYSTDPVQRAHYEESLRRIENGEAGKLTDEQTKIVTQALTALDKGDTETLSAIQKQALADQGQETH